MTVSTIKQLDKAAQRLQDAINSCADDTVRWELMQLMHSLLRQQNRLLELSTKSISIREAIEEQSQ